MLQNIEQHTCPFKMALDKLYDGVFISDQNGKTIYVNDAYQIMSGLKYEEVVGKYVTDMEAKGIYKNPVTPEVIRQGRQVNSIGKAKGGVDMLISGNPIYNEKNELVYVVVSQRDITDFQMLKQKLEVTEEKMLTAEIDREKKEEEIQYLKKRLLKKTGIIGESQGILNVISLIDKVSSLDVTLLITGESGVGKEVIANEIYQKSKTKNKHFIKVNCAAIPANLLEAELFGHVKGAFTGAIKDKLGLFQLANEGTLFLDEIGEMPVELQSKLLRAIQQKEVIPVGGSKVQKLDVRIIAATNQDLFKQVKQGKFREDLYYRLNVLPIEVPPLRERKQDIILLGQYFLNTYSKKYGKNVFISQGGFELLEDYSWPGNVRELQNIIERLVIISENGSVADQQQISRMIYPDFKKDFSFSKEKSLWDILESVEKQLITDAIKEVGSTRKVAQRLKIDQSTVVKKIKKHGIKIEK
ncbi:sigma-54 interaction domain-containing protein [Bacillus sp. EB01]|uniref:sigma-54 interaction domain-containing protein n=1 Tax=Bacillus sp. EB01 TaxID=1347086 RepID=UPI0006948BD6|nr:sigma 54-interacting transcriptional regulator [Bacillus sp. EB01]